MQKNNNFRYYFFLLIIALAVYLGYRNLQQEEEIDKLSYLVELGENHKKEILNDKKLLKKTLGQKINVFDSTFEYISKKNLENTSYKIIIVAGNNVCKPCYNDAIEYYINKGLNNNIFLIIPSKNIEFAALVGEDYMGDINIVVDKDFKFEDKYDIVNNRASLLFLNSTNQCKYSYYLEADNLQKIINNDEIIRRFLVEES